MSAAIPEQTPQAPEAPAAGDEFAFALASCQYPGGLLDRSITDQCGLSDRSWDRLGRQADRLALLVIAGDQVYVDATAGLFDAKSFKDGGRIAYESLTRVRGYRDVLRKVMLDDHEISDNWEPIRGQVPTGRRLDQLVEGCRMYLRNTTDPRPDGSFRNYKLGDALWHRFTRGGCEFFMADTRTERSGRDAANLCDVHIMGDKQRSELAGWIAAAPRDAPAFVVSPAMLLPRTLPVARDENAALFSQGWDGYPASLREILACLCEDRRDNIVFLSGDAHLSLVARFAVECLDDPGKKAVGFSIHAPALYGPYPFANAAEEDFARADEFSFAWPAQGASRQYRCTVQTVFPRVGDGYAVLETARRDGDWRLAVEFVGERRSVPYALRP